MRFLRHVAQAFVLGGIIECEFTRLDLLMRKGPWIECQLWLELTYVQLIPQDRAFVSCALPELCLLAARLWYVNTGALCM